MLRYPFVRLFLAPFTREFALGLCTVDDVTGKLAIQGIAFDGETGREIQSGKELII
jgi:hypothetical protein